MCEFAMESPRDRVNDKTMEAPHVTHWTASEPPTEASLLKLMTEEGLNPYSWSNRPYEQYFAHSHGYHKVIYVVRGSITFGLLQSGGKIILKTGDRLDLPAAILHDARVGAYGVTCLEGHQG